MHIALFTKNKNKKIRLCLLHYAVYTSRYSLPENLVRSVSELYYFQGIPMAPLWDFSRAQFVGVLSALDFILIMREVHRALCKF